MCQANPFSPFANLFARIVLIELDHHAEYVRDEVDAAQMVVVIEKLAYPVSLRRNDLGADLDVFGDRQPLNFIAGNGK